MKNRIKILPFPNIENAYIVLSGQKANSPNEVKALMSFFYTDDSIGAEWEPNYGPITVIYPCKADHPEAQPHWYFDYYKGQGYWSQLAVNEENLGPAFYNGDYEYIFAVLKKWADNHKEQTS